MRKIFKSRSILLTLTIFMLLQLLYLPAAFAETSGKNMTILFTSDMHDHILPSKTVKNGEVVESGGFARLESAINAERKINTDSLLVDAGDFSMGTPFQTIFKSDAPELRLMGLMGYDAVNIGNHEYDYAAEGLTETLKAAKRSGDKLPQIVQANVIFPADKAGKITQSVADLRDSMKDYGVKEYTVIERNGIKIGVFGLMGVYAASKAPKSEVKFTDPVENAKRIVKILKEQEKVDLIVCVSHSGIWEDKSKSEDEILAKKVPEINVIISGDTHTTLTEPIMVGNTIVGACGAYCENLGVINIKQNEDKTWSLDSYKLKSIDSSLPDDKNISEAVDAYKKQIQVKYFDKFNMKYDEVLAQTSFNFKSPMEAIKIHDEDTLGNLISDSYKYAVEKAEGENYEEVTAAIVPVGTIRGTFVKGDITTADAFTASSLGIGPDEVSGYPLISVYLTGKEIKAACEVDASVSSLMEEAQLYISGVNFTFNPNRMIFNKVTKTSIEKPDGTLEEIDDGKLYRVVAGLYSAQMLSVVGEKSYGLLSIVPKTKDGTPITDFEAQIIKDTAGGNNNELKEWLAIAQYLKSFDKVNGIPQVPAYYSETHGRKVVDDNHNIFALLSNPNNIALGVYAVAAVLILLIIFIVRMIVKRKKRKRAMKS
ncbi:MAG: bifunctional UDP-sugar hydrolase/5'-nucleotidase [Clostridiaceae bacterium]